MHSYFKLTLIILRALIFPVCLTCGPLQRSINGPHLYAKTKSVHFQAIQHFSIQSLMAHEFTFDTFKHASKYKYAENSVHLKCNCAFYLKWNMQSVNAQHT